ncbi:hypothetical protein V2H45_15810 [Tumidithrix elongata RA019]|uniref:Uncharacterized protein n=1 Tax=Tumidithrix elongata BACA0141 TaxID=2716417 RepID=A0AAW9PTZ1_9CYAN|nr:hypothetical protein [Tumidithrix elongata RA019]
MVVLSISEVKTVNLKTPLGSESGIRYLGQTYLSTSSCNGINEALQICRRDLDAGLFSIVVKECDRFSVWCPLPNLSKP